MSEKQLRELDAWIAEHVMGWHKEQSKPYAKGVDATPFAFWDGKDGAMLCEKWRPTTDPAAAMQVLEKCGIECTVQITVCKIAKPKIQIQSILSKRAISVVSDTLPLAICRFARQLFAKEWK